MESSVIDRMVLAIESQPALTRAFRSMLAASGYRMKTAATTEEAVLLCRSLKPSAALFDLGPNGLGGLELMAECLRVSPMTRFILIARSAPVAQVVAAIRAGGFDYLVDPVDADRLLTSLTAAMADAEAAVRSVRGGGLRSDLVGRSPVMAEVFSRIAAVSRSAGTVFITGESGTGKELCARAVHDNSARADGPFIVMKCSGIPHQVLEAEVFGHAPGAFPETLGERPGAAALADGGTLFLDEICDLDPALQGKLLRFVETSTITPLGASHPRAVDVRIICATNRDPEAELGAGRFREDLFYRVHVLPIRMPPLRDRGADVLEIAEHVLDWLGHEESRRFDRLADETAAAFLAYSWPGNVRQLINVLRQIVVMNRGPSVEIDMLPDDIRAMGAAQTGTLPGAIGAAPLLGLSPLVGRSMIEIERLVIEATIRSEGGSVPRAAQVLGLAPSTLYRKKESWRNL